MAIQIAIKEVLTAQQGAHSVVVTGVGFQGKLAYVFGTRTPGTQGLAGPGFNIGVDDGTAGSGGKAINGGLFTGQHFCDGWMSGLLSGRAYSFVRMRTQGLNELMVLGYISSWGIDGFTVQFDFCNVATGCRFYVVVIGGAEFECKVFGMQPNTSPFSITSLPWKPTGLFGILLADIFSSSVLLPAGGVQSFGFAGDTPCGQCAISIGDASTFGASSINWSFQESGAWLTTINQTTGAIARRWVVTSLNSNGYTITGSGGGTYVVAAMKGCAVNVGVFGQPTSTGIQSVPILASDPKLAFLFSNNKPASAVSTNDCLLSFGAGYSGGQKSIWTGALNAQPVGVEKANCVETNALGVDTIGFEQTPTGNFASTLHSQVSLSGLSANQIQLSWPTVDGNDHQWIYAVIATETGVDCGGLLIQGKGIYKIVVNKTNDTLYTTIPDTIDVKIP